MADRVFNFSALGQDNTQDPSGLGVSWRIITTVPTGYYLILSSVVVCNRNLQAMLFRLWQGASAVSPTSNTNGYILGGNDQTSAYGVTIQAGTTKVFKLPLILQAGKVLAYSTNPGDPGSGAPATLLNSASISVNAFGMLSSVGT
ncbi:hypothetical protein UFOVP967_4 [uncultured Caudovirales phage]|uniref:Uncharacterized protein n=1 Tax=uncultured Caudovirales phage TaxID=2100421 RepID=A0A6J5RDD1_9CAUD|nr:hypothetical protein UFOVP521_10 [uncultured Caudovirales phage]CAB4167990.1 hypothetical protein UFOVP856_83 [uncultured Caudovirales phage]CAB4173715.1 hypothetical protein UFOVP967_4 [uncultured Caudovirales phage]CAB4180670.1 hypothetical protein UFOVP1036_76 [uncultured Caudovirales phage]CAB4186338.1 hypothetical protein UFOVP1132_92 [uncultured Caudovirales phage]